MAFQVSENVAQCTKTDAIKYDNEEIDAPYKCTATDPNKKCQIVFEEGTADEG